MMRWLKAPATETQITHRSRLWLYFLVGVVTLFLTLPALIVVPMSFSGAQFLEFPPKEWSLKWYEAYFGSSAWMRTTRVSLSVAVLTMITATSAGTAAAYALTLANHKASRVVFILLLVPMIVPLILIAISVFHAFARLGLNNTLTGLVLAHSALALPLVVIIVSAGLRTLDMTHELVARSLGASRTSAFFLVTLPQIRASVVTAAILSFLISFDEVVVSMFVSGGRTATLTKQMFSSLRDFIDPTIAAISTLALTLSLALLLILRAMVASADRDE